MSDVAAVHMPHVFAGGRQAYMHIHIHIMCQLNSTTVMQVADMLSDDTTTAALSRALACDYVAAVAPGESAVSTSSASRHFIYTPTPAVDATGTTRTRCGGRAHRAVRSSRLNARCAQPHATAQAGSQPWEHVQHACLWGKGAWVPGRVQLQGLRPANPQRCRRARRGAESGAPGWTERSLNRERSMEADSVGVADGEDAEAREHAEVKAGDARMAVWKVRAAAHCHLLVLSVLCEWCLKTSVRLMRRYSLRRKLSL